MEVYYKTNVKISNFNPIETIEKFLIYFKMKDLASGTSFRSEFINIGYKLLSRIKEELIQ